MPSHRPPISQDLVDILVCPESHQRVTLAPPELVEDLNRRLEAGTLRRSDGEKVTERLEAGLVREDGTILYPVRGGIPLMLREEAIEIPAT